MNRRFATVLGAAVLAAAVAVPAASVSTTVTLADVSGSRTLTVTDATGTTLDAATLSTGAGASIPFVTNVTDVLYDNLTYDVDASVSNLYLWDGVSFTCGVYIPANELSISWPTEAFGVDDVSALVTDTLFDVSGTLPAISPANATLDAILTAAGVPVGTSVSGADLSRSGQGLIEETIGSVQLASGVLLSDLPLAISVGTAAPFTDAADHSTCSGGAGTPTTVNLQSGDPNASFSLADVAAAVETALGTVDGVVAGGHLTKDEVLDGIFTDAQLTSITTAVSAASLGAVWDAYVDDVITALSLDDVTINTLVGQTGTYTSVPSLDVDSALTVVGTEPTGVTNIYRGEMVITLTSS